MGAMRTVAMGLGGVVIAAILVAGGGYVWANGALKSTLAKTWDVHSVDLPIPFPLTEAELAELRAQRAAEAPPAAAAPGTDAGTEGATTDAPPLADPLAGVDLAALAMERAVARGKHLVESRYACTECHGTDFGGGTMIDAPPIGKLLGRNITTGQGSVTKDYTGADWDRAVRHGLKPDGTALVMPSVDYFQMSDRELSDIVAYIRSSPAVDKEVPPPTFGPVGTMLVATAQLRLSAALLPDHQAAHAAEAPPTAPDATFGKHVANVCTGCHRADLAGGPILGGDPSWAAAANLTPHADGLAGWTYEDFDRALTEAKSKDGRALAAPMDAMPKYMKHATDVEKQALWAYVQSVPAMPDRTK